MWYSTWAVGRKGSRASTMFCRLHGPAVHLETVVRSEPHGTWYGCLLSDITFRGQAVFLELKPSCKLYSGKDHVSSQLQIEETFCGG